MSNVNPFKNKARIDSFWEYITDGKLQVNRQDESRPIHPESNRMIDAGDFWEFECRGCISRVATVKGFSDLKTLVHPALGKHLSNSIKTGFFCSYEPEAAIEWII